MHSARWLAAITQAIVMGAILAGCSSSASSPPPPAPQTAYWTLFATATHPQIQLATTPLTAASSVTTVPSSAMLDESSDMRFDSSGRLWVLSVPSAGVANALVFTPPITAASTPTLVFTLPASNDIDHIIFDSAGNLWASDFSGKKEYKFTPPFTTS
jgi:hypothetical protein